MLPWHLTPLSAASHVACQCLLWSSTQDNMTHFRKNQNFFWIFNQFYILCKSKRYYPECVHVYYVVVEISLQAIALTDSTVATSDYLILIIMDLYCVVGSYIKALRGKCLFLRMLSSWMAIWLLYFNVTDTSYSHLWENQDQCRHISCV